MGNLFDIKDIRSEPEASALQLQISKSSSPEELLQVSSRARDLLKLIFDELTPNKHIDFCTAGELSIHQIIQYALNLTGPADVYLSSWTIKEDPARALLFLKETGKIKQLFGVFDHRLNSDDAKHFHLIEKAFTQYVLTKNHSKVVVIIGQNLSICIVGSANLSNNPRIEAGFISTYSPTVEFHKQWMEQVLSGKKVY